MSVANVTMFEFQTAESVEEFASWYKDIGSHPNNDVSLFVRTGETSAIGISVYRYIRQKKIGKMQTNLEMLEHQLT